MSSQDIRDTSSVNGSAVNRRDILLASTSVAVASALGSTALIQITQAQAQTAQGGAETPITEQEAHAIGVNAYLYFYSLVSMDVTRRVATNVEAGKIPGYGPANMFQNFAAFPAADFKGVVRPNFDTLYSSAFLDMTKEPMIVSRRRGQRFAPDRETSPLVSQRPVSVGRPTGEVPRQRCSRLCHVLFDKSPIISVRSEPQSAIGTWREKCPVKTFKTRRA